MIVRHRIFLVVASVLAVALAARAQVDPKLCSDMKLREIGPTRAGRTSALVGVPSEPATFYLGAVNGGVWKATDAGATWHSVSDSDPSGSIGSIAVSKSEPNIVYVASGEGLQRPAVSTSDGVYKSTDAGRSWTHLEGLRDGQQIGQVAIDPKNPDRGFLAVTGHPYGPNEERGLYRMLGGGKTFKRVLFANSRTGASEMHIDPQHPSIVFAGMWQGQEAPWENGSFIGADGGLYRSADGGDSWTKLTGGGLPGDVLQVRLTVSPSASRRIYAAVPTTHATVGLYRSDDGGVNWIHPPVNAPRLEARIGGGDVPVPKVNPNDPDTVYAASVVTWNSTNAWYGLRGAPGGDDYQNVFVNPNNTKITALASNQGIIISQNGGETWTQWFNQATVQVYDVTADNAFPYRVCDGQQDSGSACVDSRSNDGRITFHDWHPAGIEEFGYAAPDLLDPDIVYGGKVSRYDRTPSVSTAPWVMPGTYTVRLIAGGKTLSEPLNIVTDPRVKTQREELEEQFPVAKSIYDATAAMHKITVLHDQLKARASQAPVAAAGDSIESKLGAISGGGRGCGGGGPTGPANLTTVRLAVARIEKQIENGDQAPTAAQVEAWHITTQPLAGLLDQWEQLKHTDLKALNEQLAREHLALRDVNTQNIDHNVEDQIETGNDN